MRVNPFLIQFSYGHEEAPRFFVVCVWVVESPRTHPGGFQQSMNNMPHRWGSGMGMHISTCWGFRMIGFSQPNSSPSVWGWPPANRSSPLY